MRQIFLLVAVLLCHAICISSYEFNDDEISSMQLYMDALRSLNDEKKNFRFGDGNIIGVRQIRQVGKRGLRNDMKRLQESMFLEKEFTSADGDYIEHDCLTIKPYTVENWSSEPWNKGLSKKKFIQMKGEKEFVRYNSAYGIPMIGTAQFSEESLLRGCYLIRYMFADNQHLRIAARRSGIYNYGFKGGVCCPPQMGNNGLSCQCNSKFPISGKGAPAHEMAHFFLSKLLPPMVKDGRLKLPPYVNNNGIWAYQPVVNEDTEKCRKAEALVEKYGDYYTWLWNAQKQDRLRGKSNVEQCKVHHYFIYTGQENWLFKGNKKVIEKSRPCFQKKSPNLYNLMQQVWPCSNNYIPVCKDASRGFKLGLAQAFTIGKVDPSDESKMICREGLDKAEIKQENVPEMEQPKEDGASKNQCLKVARKVDTVLASTPRKNLHVNAFIKYLQDDQEFAWYLRRCCAKTLKFDNSVPLNFNNDEMYEVNDGTCDGNTTDEDDVDGMESDDLDE